VQVERAGAAVADPRECEVMAARHGRAQLAGEDAGAGQAQAAFLRQGWRGQPMERIFGDAIKVEMPRDDCRAGRRRPKRCQGCGRAGDRQPVVQPVGMGEAQRGAGDARA
jgi:hypothetical protein